MITIYRLLLLAYPRSLRDAHGAEMTAVFAERWRTEGHGVRARARLIVLLTADVIASLPRAWFPPDRRPGRAPEHLEHRARFERRRISMRDLLADVIIASRYLRRSWAFAASAVVTLGLGIGATTAVFSLADATLLRPLPIVEADRVLQSTFSWSLPDYRDLEADQAVFADVAAWSGFDVAVDHGGETTMASSLAVSGRYFALAGIQAVHGRLLAPADDQAGAPATAVLSERLWRAAFDADPAVVGASLRLSGRPVTVVGIAPAWFRGFSLRGRPEIFVPLTAVPDVATGFIARPELQASRGSVWLQVAGRLKPGVDPAAARAETERHYRRGHPPDEDASTAPEPVELVPLTAGAIGLDTADDLGRFVGVLLGATGVTLLLACGAVGSLLLVRTRARRREFAIRAALGGRGRIGRLLVTEAILIGIGGVAFGLVVARLALGLLTRFSLPGDIPIGDLAVTLNLSMLGVAAAVGLLTSVAFTLAPLAHAMRIPASEVLAEGARGSSGRPISAVLVAGQVAVCVLLLGGSLAFGRAIQTALATDLGFTTTGTAMASVELGATRRPAAAMLQLHDDVLRELAAESTVAAAGWAKTPPFRGSMTMGVAMPGVDIDGRYPETNIVSAGYLDTLQIPILRGRTFDTAADRPDGTRVAVISEMMARTYWDGEDPIGRVFYNDDTPGDPERALTVIGVAGDIRRGLAREVGPSMYLLAAQHPDLADFGGNHLFVRNRDGAGPAVAAAAAALARVDRTAPVSSLITLDDAFGTTLMAQQLGLTLFLIFGVLALTLTVLGLYALVAHTVAFRRREIGIRVALGASRGQVVGLMSRQGLAPVTAGLVLGTGGLWLSAPALERFLFAEPAMSAGVLLTLVLLLGAASAAAIAGPVRHALRIDPAVALRND